MTLLPILYYKYEQRNSKDAVANLKRESMWIQKKGSPYNSFLMDWQTRYDKTTILWHNTNMNKDGIQSVILPSQQVLLKHNVHVLVLEKVENQLLDMPVSQKGG